MASVKTLEDYRFLAVGEASNSFESGQGLGPFTVQQHSLRKEILEEASPTVSYHISGCKGAGKTTLLKLLGHDLLEKKKSVYLFRNARDIDLVRSDIDEVIAKKAEAYFLIDETQGNVNSAVFTHLLKNDLHHQITTIGAGVPAFESLSSAFTEKIATDRLFLSEQDLTQEGVLHYFTTDVTDTNERNEIEKFITELRSYVGGHIYPLMRLSELLVQKMKNDKKTSDQTTSVLNSVQFRESKFFKRLCARIMPSLQDVDIRALFAPRSYALSPTLIELQRRGFCDMEGKVASPLLLDLHLASLSRSVPAALNRPLPAGVTGVQELLSFGAPAMSWEAYNSHGGPVEDALTFELLHVLAGVKSLGVMLFNPKLVTAGTSARRPDIYFDSNVHCYVECVLTNSNTEWYRKDVEKHVLSFFPSQDGQPPHYQIQSADFAILHFQGWGDAPMQLQREECVHCFNERVFTFLLQTKQLFLGNTRIVG